MPKYLIIATEYGAVVAATYCDTREGAEDIAENSYNAHKYHTQGDVLILEHNDEEEEYQNPESLHHENRVTDLDY
jgi:hypothetical protein